MASRVTPLLILAAATGGCASLPAESPRDAEVERAIQTAALQVRRCYRTPRVSSDGRLIVTRLLVRLTPDGQLAGLPEVLGQSGVTAANRPYAGAMAEAAIGAVMRCAPLRLPPSSHAGGWSEFMLTFSPLAAA